MRSSSRAFALLCLPVTCYARRVQASVGQGIINQIISVFPHSSREASHQPQVQQQVNTQAPYLFHLLHQSSQVQTVSPQLPSESRNADSTEDGDSDGVLSLSSKLRRTMRFRGGATNIMASTFWKLAPVFFFAFYLWSLFASHGEKTLRALEKIDFIGTIIWMFIFAIGSVFTLRMFFFGAPHLRLSNLAMAGVIGATDSLISCAASMGLPNTILGLLTVLVSIPLVVMVGSISLSLDLLIEAAPVLLILSPFYYFLWKLASRHLSPFFTDRLKVGLGRTTMFSLLGIQLWMVGVHIFVP